MIVGLLTWERFQSPPHPEKKSLTLCQVTGKLLPFKGYSCTCA